MSNIDQVNVKVIVGDGTEISCTKRGNLRLTDGKGELLLQRVLYSPKIHKNIVSIGSLIRDGHQVEIENRMWQPYFLMLIQLLFCYAPA